MCSGTTSAATVKANMLPASDVWPPRQASRGSIVTDCSQRPGPPNDLGKPKN